MELIKFNSETCPVGARLEDSLAVIRFGKKGVIEINKSAADSLKLNSDSRIELLQDAKSKKDWYVCISETGYKLRSSKDIKFPYRFNNSKITNEIFAAFSTEKNSIRLKLAEVTTEHDGVMLYGLIKTQ